MADTILGNLSPQELMALLRMGQEQQPAPQAPANAQISGSQEPSLLDIFFGGKKAAEDRLAANRHSRRPYVIGDPTPLSPVTEAVADPSGLNTLLAGGSLIPLANKLPTKQTLAGLGGLFAASTAQAQSNDSQRNGGMTLWDELAQVSGLKKTNDRDAFRQKWETSTPAPQSPGTKEEYMARRRAELESSPAYQERIKRGQLKTAQAELAVQLEKIAKSDEFEKAIADYDTRLKGRQGEFDEAWNKELATRDNLQKKYWSKPFNERQPDTANTIFAASLLGPMVAGWRSVTQPAQTRASLLDDIARARKGSSSKAENRARDALESFENDANKNAMKSLLKSTAFPVETRALMDIYDAKAAPADSEAHRIAADKYLKPENWTGTGADMGRDALSGLLTWASGNLAARHLRSDPNYNKARSDAELKARRNRR